MTIYPNTKYKKTYTEGDAPTEIEPTDRFIKLPAVVKLVGLSRGSIYKLLRRNQFPLRRYLGGNNVVWIEREILEWMAEQAKNTRPH